MSCELAQAYRISDHASELSRRSAKSASVRTIATSTVHILQTLSTFVLDQGDYHAVEVVEEHEQMEAEFDERFSLVYVELAEDLGGV